MISHETGHGGAASGADQPGRGIGDRADVGDPGAALRLAQRRFRALVEQSPLSTQVYAPDGTTLLVNRAWETLWGLTLDELGDYNILRDPQLAAQGLLPAVERAFAGEPTTLPPLRYEPARSVASPAAVPYRWVRAVIYPVKDDAGHVQEVVVQHEDVTERMQARRVLEERVAARTEELTTLLEVAHLLSSTLELAPLLDLIFAQLARVAPYTGAAIWLVDGDHLVMVADRAPTGEAATPGLRLPINPFWWADIAPRPALVADVRDERDQSQAARSYRAAVGGRFGYSRAWMRVPLLHKDRPIGMLSLSHREPGYYTPHHADLALAIASQAASAIENARLYARAQESAALERRVAERTRELASLLDVTHTLTATLELGPLLQLILEQLACVVAYHGASILTAQGGELTLLASRIPEAPTNAAATVGLRFPFAGLGDTWAVLARGEPVIIADVRGASPAARDYRRAVGPALETVFSVVSAWLAVPLLHQGRLTGLLTVSWPEPGHFTARDAALAAAFASHVAVAIENARLYEGVAARTRELATLLDVSHHLASTLDLGPLLGLLLDQLRGIVEYDAAAVFLLADADTLDLLEYKGPLPRARLAERWALADAEHSREVIRTRRPVLIPDVRADTPLAVAFRWKAVRDLGAVPADIGAWLGVPLLRGDTAIGVLAFDHHRVGAFTPRHADLIMTAANQAAVAIENARLYARAQESAALEERQRLARELHDSVTQALFSMTLHARATQLAIERSGIAAESPAGRGVTQLRALAQGALAEMRALIFELRPGALAEEGLAAALAKQATALAAREGLEVRVEVPGTRLSLAPAVEEHLYRLGQEALHNVVKHAGAHRATVRLAATGPDLTLEIADDGRGFDPAVSRPGHLGLGTMAERARAVGASLAIESAPDRGTTVRVLVPGALEGRDDGE